MVNKISTCNQHIVSSRLSVYKMGGCFLNDGKMILGCTEHIQKDRTYLLAEFYYIGVGSSLDIHQTYALNLATYSVNSLLSAVC